MDSNRRSAAIQAGRRLVARGERPLYRVKLTPLTEGRVRLAIVEMPWLTAEMPTAQGWRERALELVVEQLSCRDEDVTVAPF